mmetsp:Transcript_27389/g.49535  ORF Transcript_27389/g.49535 Transcript_27389/m.49535 type:complete len:257 (-) Transcript_27389:1003-1773(-)
MFTANESNTILGCLFSFASSKGRVGTRIFSEALLGSIGSIVQNQTIQKFVEFHLLIIFVVIRNSRIASRRHVFVIHRVLGAFGFHDNFTLVQVHAASHFLVGFNLSQKAFFIHIILISISLGSTSGSHTFCNIHIQSLQSPHSHLRCIDIATCDSTIQFANNHNVRQLSIFSHLLSLIIYKLCLSQIISKAYISSLHEVSQVRSFFKLKVIDSQVAFLCNRQGSKTISLFAGSSLFRYVSSHHSGLLSQDNISSQA